MTSPQQVTVSVLSKMTVLNYSENFEDGPYNQRGKNGTFNFWGGQ